MPEKVDKVFGPGLHHLSRLGWFTRFVLWFYPLVVHETANGIVAYKIRKGTMYVFGATRKPSQSDKAGQS